MKYYHYTKCFIRTSIKVQPDSHYYTPCRLVKMIVFDWLNHVAILRHIYRMVYMWYNTRYRTYYRNHALPQSWFSPNFWTLYSGNWFYNIFYENKTIYYDNVQSRFDRQWMRNTLSVLCTCIAHKLKKKHRKQGTRRSVNPALICAYVAREMCEFIGSFKPPSLCPRIVAYACDYILRAIHYRAVSLSLNIWRWQWWWL